MFNSAFEDDLCVIDLHISFYSACSLKGGYLDFLHLIELKNVYITEIYMKTIQITNNQES